MQRSGDPFPGQIYWTPDPLQNPVFRKWGMFESLVENVGPKVFHLSLNHFNSTTKTISSQPTLYKVRRNDSLTLRRQRSNSPVEQLISRWQHKASAAIYWIVSLTAVPGASAPLCAKGRRSVWSPSILITTSGCGPLDLHYLCNVDMFVRFVANVVHRNAI